MVNKTRLAEIIGRVSVVLFILASFGFVITFFMLDLTSAYQTGYGSECGMGDLNCDGIVDVGDTLFRRNNMDQYGSTIYILEMRNNMGNVYDYSTPEELEPTPEPVVEQAPSSSGVVTNEYQFGGVINTSKIIEPIVLSVQDVFNLSEDELIVKLPDDKPKTFAASKTTRNILVGLIILLIIGAIWLLNSGKKKEEVESSSPNNHKEV